MFIMYIMYIIDFSVIPEKHGLSSHFYADDVQLYLSFHRTQTALCASRVSTCMLPCGWPQNRLMVNPAKTDVLWCSTSQTPPDALLSPAGNTVQPSVSVCNLGVLFDVLSRCSRQSACIYRSLLQLSATH